MSPLVRVATVGPGAVWCLLLAVSTLGLAAPGSASAQPAPDAPAVDDARVRAKAHNARARKLFVLGRFREAAAQYEQAYQAKPLPTFLFNLAQCHKRLNTAADLERAVFYYRGYMRSTPGGKDHPRIEAQIVELRARAAELKADDADVKNDPEHDPDPPDPGITPPKNTDGETAPPKNTDGETTPPADTDGGAVPVVRDGRPVPGVADPPSPPLYTRWWLWTAVGVAVVGGSVAAIVAATTGGDDRVPGGPPHDWTSFKLRSAP